LVAVYLRPMLVAPYRLALSYIAFPTVDMPRTKTQHTMSWPSSGQDYSSGDDTIIGFTRGPPAIMQHGITFSVSVMVKFGESSGLSLVPTQAFAVNVSLVDEYGTRTSGVLQGNLTSNIQFHPTQGAHGFAVFGGLSICQTGLWRLRVLLGAFSCAEMAIEARVDSIVFHVAP